VRKAKDCQLRKTCASNLLFKMPCAALISEVKFII